MRDVASILTNKEQIKEAYYSNNQGTLETSNIIFAHLKLSCHFVAKLFEQIDELKSENMKLISKLNESKAQIDNYKQKYHMVKKEGNVLKRYNSKLLMNSFISDLTDIPNHNAKSQVRTKHFYEYPNN